VHGPAGTGKTLIGKFLKAKFGERLVAIRGPEIFSKFVGETEAALRMKFDEAKAK
jgi:SpoVK/Ycf46/Vps4 family AAA+-type ATPase